MQWKSPKAYSVKRNKNSELKHVISSYRVREEKRKTNEKQRGKPTGIMGHHQMNQYTHCGIPRKKRGREAVSLFKEMAERYLHGSVS